MLKRLLIANRGEIARRIIRTCERLGVETVAVYSDADADAPHVREATTAVRIGPAPARESYLDMGAVLTAARESGADSVHPGYGFLSENAAFAEAVIAAGLTWVGPPPAAIRAMGLKDAAKRLMQEAGVPVTPGYLGDDQSPERLAREVDAVGYPVLIKAVAGGGGKGMRRVDDPAAFAEALAGAQREGAASFGDDRVLIEKYVTRPRHIEVQVFADRHGNVVHLYERDCSLQRRHQKVIEEAPAPGMDAATREQVCAAAVAAARAVAYEGAGTVEFIADASEGLRADRIWFMEMNTRLQVEHPVTEMITGQDLVEWQLRVASGEPLPLTQGLIPLNGWAMEARLYAENPATGFLPSMGKLEHFRLPEQTWKGHEHLSRREREGPAAKPGEGEGFRGSESSPASLPPHPPTALGGGSPLLPLGEGIRVDSGVEQGGEVTPFYDPMIAKLIAHAPTREAAAAKLAQACKSVEVWPVKTNAAFLARCLEQPDFVAGQVDTGFIEGHEQALMETIEPTSESVAAAFGFHLDRAADPERRLRWAEPAKANNPWGASPDGLYGFRVNGPSRTTAVLDNDGTIYRADVCAGNDDFWRWKITLDGVEMQVVTDGPNVNDVLHLDWMSRQPKIRPQGDGVLAFENGQAFLFQPPLFEDAGQAAASSGQLSAPMPGRIVSVSAAVGDEVKRGAPVVALEAMKMEHALVAPFDARVAEIAVQVGDQVVAGAVLARLEAL